MVSATAENIKNIFELRQQDEWQFKSEMTDDLGFTHRRYQQYYLGLEVFGGEIIVHEKDNKIQTINGHFYPNINSTVIAGVSEQVAIAKAKQHIGAEQWQWETGNETY